MNGIIQNERHHSLPMDVVPCWPTQIPYNDFNMKYMFDKRAFYVSMSSDGRIFLLLENAIT